MIFSLLLIFRVNGNQELHMLSIEEELVAKLETINSKKRDSESVKENNKNNTNERIINEDEDHSEYSHLEEIINSIGNFVTLSHRLKIK